jgi:hypothetical protein
MRRIIVPVILALVMTALAAGNAFAVDSTTFTTSAPNAALPKADLLIMQAPDVLYASPRQLVTFTSYAANNGPSTSQLDAIVEGKVNLSVKRQRCQFVSPDTPSCEFGGFVSLSGAVGGSAASRSVQHLRAVDNPTRVLSRQERSEVGGRIGNPGRGLVSKRPRPPLGAPNF